MIDTMSWHILTADNEQDVHQKPLVSKTKPLIVTVTLRWVATSKSARTDRTVKYAEITGTFSKTWHQRLQTLYNVT